MGRIMGVDSGSISSKRLRSPAVPGSGLVPRTLHLVKIFLEDDGGRGAINASLVAARHLTGAGGADRLGGAARREALVPRYHLDTWEDLPEPVEEGPDALDGHAL